MKTRQMAWLPVVGPTGYLLWTTIAAQLRQHPIATWPFSELARAHGISRQTGSWGPLRRSLVRLDQFDLITPAAIDEYVVRLNAPPIPTHARHDAPTYVQALHDQLYRTALQLVR